MYLFFDTETTGLPKKWKAPVSDIFNWPRMVQLAWLSFDEEGKLQSSHNHIIKPEGYRIPDFVTNIHGIDTATALRKGEDLATVLKVFAGAIDRADLLVAHNFDFDDKIVRSEFFRKDVDHKITEKASFCTMKDTTHVSMPRNPRSRGWSKLSDLHTNLFGEQFDNAHNALADVQACARCFFELKNKDLI